MTTVILSSPSKNNIDAWLMSEMTAKSGGRFTPSDDYWRPDPTAQAANVASAKCAVIDKVRPWLIAALSYYAMEYSARTLKHLAYVLSKCGNSSLDVLDESNIIAVRNILSKSEFAVLRSFLKRWREDYLLEVKPSEAVVDYLYAIKPRNNVGQCPVESMNPEKGPLTPLERRSIFDWANDAFAYGRITIEQFVYIRILITTGVRIRQVQQLVFGDIIEDERGYFLKMPRAKNKGFGYRNSFKTFDISKDLYIILVSYKEITLKALQRERLHVDWKKAIPNVALFRAKGTKFVKTIIKDDPDLSLLEIEPQIKFHKHDGSMKALLRGLEDDQAFPVSERTGEKIHLGAHRFRYTIGTELSRMDAGRHTIAFVLDHKGVRSVSRYIKVSAAMGKRIDDKMKNELSLIVNAFQGRLVAGAADAVNGSLTNKTIRTESSAIATCGASGGCHLDAPVACYTCSKFQPWLDAPHEEVLNRLMLRQQRAIDVAGEESEVAISFDRPILAVMQVIHSINALKQNAEGEHDE
ncbi:hypothetical protein [Halomonas sp.]|uniref:hypothetical protein n=1 Tax=Halomonas sp. TaxID=1486246 RepID=UPI00298E2424|nr:hypothetical protein [Halomonas sp.]MDW7746375.1 hypothetical protein [Halomonas sp.]